MGISLETKQRTREKYRTGPSTSYSREVQVRHVENHQTRPAPQLASYQRPTRGRRRLCSLEQRRQTHSLFADRMMTMEVTKDNTDIDKLPVVELRPFTKKEWRPSKSVPVGLERAHTILSNTPVATSGRKNYDFESKGYPNPGRHSSTTPRNHATSPNPRAFSVAGERSITHPRIRDITTKVSPSSSSNGEHVEAFVPKLERQKTTITDIRSGRNINSQYSCSKRALTDFDVQVQQGIRIHGRKFDHLPPKHYELSNYYKLTQSYTIPTVAQDNPANSEALMEDLYLRLEHLENAYLDEDIYDSFDRTITLPSIKVRKAPMRPRRPMTTSAAGVSTGTSPPNSAEKTNGPAYRLGVTNSLDLLSHYGRPAGVEQQLTVQLKSTIDHLRRAKDNTSVVAGAYKLVPRYDWSPTFGESQILSALRANTTRADKPSAELRPAPAAHGWQSRATSHGRSDVIDSGFESSEGTKGATKGYRALSSRQQVPSSSERDHPASNELAGILKTATASEPVLYHKAMVPDSRYNAGMDAPPISIHDQQLNGHADCEDPHEDTNPEKAPEKEEEHDRLAKITELECTLQSAGNEQPIVEHEFPTIPGPADSQVTVQSEDAERQESRQASPLAQKEDINLKDQMAHTGDLGNNNGINIGDNAESVEEKEKLERADASSDDWSSVEDYDNEGGAPIPVPEKNASVDKAPRGDSPKAPWKGEDASALTVETVVLDTSNVEPEGQTNDQPSVYTRTSSPGHTPNSLLRHATECATTEHESSSSESRETTQGDDLHGSGENKQQSITARPLSSSVARDNDELHRGLDVGSSEPADGQETAAAPGEQEEGQEEEEEEEDRYHDADEPAASVLMPEYKV